MSVYGGTKAAARNFAHSWAVELAPRRIRVNALLPGPSDTAGMTDSRQEVQAAGGDWTHSTPLGELGTAEDVAAAALFLASAQSAFVTGTDLVVDGGNLAT